MLVAQQHLIGKAAALRMNQRNLPSALANQIVAGGFGSEGMIELNAVVALAVEAVHQHHVRAVNIQGKRAPMISTLSHNPQVNSSSELITPLLVLAKRSSRCFWCWLSCFSRA